MRTLKAGEMFAGYGGLALAVSSVFGAKTAWLCEVDKYASEVLEHRFPDVPNLGDVTAVDWGSVEPVDIIAGGSPCQDVSVAGGRAGMSEAHDQTFGLRCVTQYLSSNQVSWFGRM
jgi:gp69